MKRISVCKDKDGLSLIPAAVLAGVMAFAITFIYDNVVTSVQIAKTFESGGDLENLEQQVRLVLSDRQMCGSNFQADKVNFDNPLPQNVGSIVINNSINQPFTVAAVGQKKGELLIQAIEVTDEKFEDFGSVTAPIIGKGGIHKSGGETMLIGASRLRATLRIAGDYVSGSHGKIGSKSFELKFLVNFIFMDNTKNTTTAMKGGEAPGTAAEDYQKLHYCWLDDVTVRMCENVGGLHQGYTHPSIPYCLLNRFVVGPSNTLPTSAEAKNLHVSGGMYNTGDFSAGEYLVGGKRVCLEDGTNCSFEERGPDVSGCTWKSTDTCNRVSTSSNRVETFYLGEKVFEAGVPTVVACPAEGEEWNGTYRVEARGNGTERISVAGMDLGERGGTIELAKHTPDPTDKWGNWCRLGVQCCKIKTVQVAGE